MLLPETSDHRYQVVKILGQGGSADVYLARHLALGELRVLKVLHQSMLPDPKRRVKFLQEAKLAAHLRHPAIVRVFDVTQTPASLQIEMEYVDGLSLRQHLERRTRFPLPVALAVVYAVLEGLEHAHASKLVFDNVEYDGVIHRDLKPENILLRQDGQPVICDFGIAKLGADLLSMTQNVSGSVPYMAPERLRGEPSTRAIDVFAMGVLFFEMLAGYRPFRGDNRTQVIENILKWNIADLAADLGGIDPAAVAAIQKALERDPAQRFADAGQMRDALRPVYRQYHGEAAPFQPVGDFLRLGRITTTDINALLPPESNWRRKAAWMGSLLLIAGAAAGGWFVWQRSQEPVPDFAMLLDQGKLEDAEKLLPEDAKRRQGATFRLAQAYWGRHDASRALWWTDQAMNLGYHPRIAALRAEVYLESGMRERSRVELDGLKPFVPRAGVESQAQYHWLRARWFKDSPKPLGPAESKELRQHLQAVLRLVGHPSDPRRTSAQAWLSEIR